jgi:hypothetical protein
MDLVVSDITRVSNDTEFLNLAVKEFERLWLLFAGPHSG